MGFFDFIEGLKKAGKSVGGGVGSIAYHVIGEAGGKKLAEVGVAKTTEKLFEDKRGELMQDILAAAPDNENLLRRHKETLKNKTENRFVTLLTKIPRYEEEEIGKDPKTKKPIIKKRNVRVEILKKMNSLEDEKFSQYLDMLENDMVKQFLQRIWLKANEQWKRELRELEEKVESFFQESGFDEKLDELERKSLSFRQKHGRKEE